MTSKNNVLDSALQALRQGEVLTIDAVAQHAGLTKPGVVHHFPTKEALTVAVVNRVLDLWEDELQARADKESSATEKLKAYVDWTLMGQLDPSDLALLADARLREKLSEQWSTRLDPWLGSQLRDPKIQAARLIADGAWFDRALGVIKLSQASREEIRAIALTLINESTLT